jgi:cytochrome c oxidase cbb3-type subunit 2
LSNVPAVFAATAQLQTMIALGLALLGGIAASFMQPRISEVAETPDYKSLGMFLWSVIFLALVWLDSAGFYVLQHTYALRAQTWSGEWTLWGNASTHLLGALLAGFALDALRSGGTALVALVLLVSADTLLNRGMGQFFGTRMCYTMGVSAYSVALVYYPAIGARPWAAARLFSVAGWIGSALGIGMVQDLHAIPVGFIGLATGVVVVALAVRHGSQRGRTAILLLGLGALCFNPRPLLRADETNITRGREVYLAEGCINCHSQYVRPGVAQEVLWWGPARPLVETLAEAPPLIGLRRQGPDLMNIGSRRSPEWQRLHLIDPQAVLPGSRMPSYAYLFQGADGRGESLVAYLATLGSETLPARLLQIALWTPAAEAIAAPYRPADARRQFGQRCASCHGIEGRGDGPLSAQLSLKPPDFLQDNWRHLLPNEPVRAVALARIIKFGVPGTAMAGHEYLDDSSVVQLARFVEATHR